MIFSPVRYGPGPADQDLRLLERLRDALEARGVHACLRPGTEALLVYGPDKGLPTWVFIGYGGTAFAWQNAERRHSVKDVLGAAEVLKSYVERGGAKQRP